MPQLSVQQAIVAESIPRLNQTPSLLSNLEAPLVQSALQQFVDGIIQKINDGQLQPSAGGFQDRKFELTPAETEVAVAICKEFIRVPAEPGGPTP